MLRTTHARRIPTGGTARPGRPVGRWLCALVLAWGVAATGAQAQGVLRYGGTIAAPVFGKIGARLAAHMNLTPTEPVEDKDKLAGTQDP